ncbi:MAG: universal stress protein [Chloroflexota bacterium]
MTSRILIPLDGSPMAEEVLLYVKQLAAGLKLQPTLLRVIEPTPEEIRSRMGGKAPSPIPEVARKEAEQYLEKISTYLGKSVPSPRAVVVDGDPAVEIIAEAEKSPLAIVAMSTHGRSGLARWLIGSVAEKVLLYSSNPLLLVHPKPRSPIATEPKLTTLLVPLDGSTVAEQVLPHVVELGKGLGISVVLVRVTWSLADYYSHLDTTDAYGAVPHVDYTQIAKEVDDDAMNYLKVCSAKLSQQGVRKVSEHLAHGDPAAAIVSLADETPNSLIAMTTRGRTGLARTLLGSVADRVVRHSGEPVFIVRPK